MYGLWLPQFVTQLGEISLPGRQGHLVPRALPHLGASVIALSPCPSASQPCPSGLQQANPGPFRR